tara:strand:- start:421 stop:528 length:108 start_codon:yes stop_codon:yes gene_type:complete
MRDIVKYAALSLLLFFAGVGAATTAYAIVELIALR